MTTSLPAHAVAPGDLVDGRYRVVELIGEGPQRILGHPPGPQPSNKAGDLGGNRRRR